MFKNPLWTWPKPQKYFLSKPLIWCFESSDLEMQNKWRNKAEAHINKIFTKSWCFSIWGTIGTMAQVVNFLQSTSAHNLNQEQHNPAPSKIGLALILFTFSDSREFKVLKYIRSSLSMPWKSIVAAVNQRQNTVEPMASLEMGVLNHDGPTIWRDWKEITENETLWFVCISLHNFPE